jgi:hypothetical protein
VQQHCTPARPRLRALPAEAVSPTVTYVSFSSADAQSQNPSNSAFNQIQGLVSQYRAVQYLPRHQPESTCENLWAFDVGHIDGDLHIYVSLTGWPLSLTCALAVHARSPLAHARIQPALMSSIGSSRTFEPCIQ